MQHLFGGAQPRRTSGGIAAEHGSCASNVALLICASNVALLICASNVALLICASNVASLICASNVASLTRQVKVETVLLKLLFEFGEVWRIAEGRLPCS